MFEEIKLRPCMSVLDAETKAVGISQVIKVMKDGLEYSRTVQNVIFECNKLDELKAFLGVDESPEITYITELWSLN